MNGEMTLRIVTPGGVLLDDPVAAIAAQVPNGSFGMLPRHVDFVSELSSGVLCFREPGGREHFVGLSRLVAPLVATSVMQRSPQEPLSSLVRAARDRRGRNTAYPLYEGKMFWHFDHRYGTYEIQTVMQANKGVLPRITDAHHSDPKYQIQPRYWIDKSLTEAALS